MEKKNGGEEEGLGNPPPAHSLELLWIVRLQLDSQMHSLFP